jgi:hypothetical protein
MKFKFLVVILVLSMLFVVPGCDPQTPTPSNCSASDLVPAFLITPYDFETVSSLTPTLSWGYPTSLSGYSYYYGASDCLPEKYRVTLSTGPFFTDNLGVNAGPISPWVTPTLEPGTEYRWGVEGMIGGTPGPFAGYWHFFTGPTCDNNTNALVEPTLLQPGISVVLDDDWPVLYWDYPQRCLPDEYYVQVSTTSDFSIVSQSGYTYTPSMYWALGGPLDNCTTYFWRVAAMDGVTVGPFSAANPFFINLTGTCPAKGGVPTPTNEPPIPSSTPPPAPIISYCPAYTDLQACTNDPDCRWWASNYGQSGNCANR